MRIKNVKLYRYLDWLFDNFSKTSPKYINQIELITKNYSNEVRYIQDSRYIEVWLTYVFIIFCLVYIKLYIQNTDIYVFFV